MSRRARKTKEERGTASRLRNRKTIAIIAGPAAVVVLALVLVLVVFTPPDDNGVPSDVLALVNGESITSADVSEMQRLVLYWDGEFVDADQVLDQLITQRLLFREAERRDYVPSDVDVEIELIMRLGILGMPLDQLYLILQEAGISYDEFLEYRKVQAAITVLLDDDVEQPEVTEEEALAYYEDYRERYMEKFGGREPRPFETMRSEIIGIVQAEKRQDAIFAYVKELRANADIIYIEDDGLPL